MFIQMVSLDLSEILFRYCEIASSLSSQNKQHGNTFWGLDDGPKNCFSIDEPMARFRTNPVYIVLDNPEPLFEGPKWHSLIADPMKMTTPATSPMSNG